MSKIKEILNDNKSIIALDIDGVLASMEWGDYNHFGVNDEEWEKMYQNEGTVYYTEKCVCKKMQNFLKDKNKNNLYVITRAYNENEWKDKISFAYNNFEIPKDHVYYVDNDAKKADVLSEIKKEHLEVDEHHIVMIDDTVDVLNAIMDKTNFTTVHISSFLDM